jgi:hypothetical protein
MNEPLAVYYLRAPVFSFLSLAFKYPVDSTAPENIFNGFLYLITVAFSLKNMKQDIEKGKEDS